MCDSKKQERRDYYTKNDLVLSKKLTVCKNQLLIILL